MRRLIRAFDDFLAWAYGVYEFCDDPDCILRLQRTRLSHSLDLPGGRLAKGEPAVGLHLWNRRLPPIPSSGPDLAWASLFRRRFVRSLHAAAREMQRDPRLAGARAVGGATGVVAPGDSGARTMQRLGFTVIPCHRPLGRFGEFWENLYSYWLLWAYSPASLRGRQLLGLRRTEMWMAADEFLRRYGRD